jgi:hypothetical protein
VLRVLARLRRRGALMRAILAGVAFVAPAYALLFVFPG